MWYSFSMSLPYYFYDFKIFMILKVAYTQHWSHWLLRKASLSLLDADSETPRLRPPHEKSWLIGKDPDAGRDRGQEEKGTTEDEMAGWHHQLDAHEFGWTPGVGDGQGGLACCDSWGCKESDRTEWLNWTEIRRSGISQSYCKYIFLVYKKLPDFFPKWLYQFTFLSATCKFQLLHTHNIKLWCWQFF